MTAEPHYPERYSNEKISPMNGQSTAFLASLPALDSREHSCIFLSTTRRSVARDRKMSFANVARQLRLGVAFEMVFFKDFIQSGNVIFSSSVATNTWR